MKTVRMLMFFQGTAINFFRALFLLQMLILAYFKLITLGEFFSLLFYSFAIFSPLGEIGNVITKYPETRASLENVETHPRPGAGARATPAARCPTASSPWSSPASPTATRRHGRPRCSDVSFTARSGESVAFVGPSGAGKSTLIKLLLGLYQPDRGRILFNGVDSAEVNYDLLRTRVGFVPQSIELFAGTIRDNLKFVRQEATDEECMASLEAAQLRGLLERVAAGPGHAHRRGRAEALRRRTAAAGHCARAAAEARPADLRRGHQLPGHGDGEGDHAHHRRDHPHAAQLRDAPHRPPAFHHRRADRIVVLRKGGSSSRARTWSC